MVASGYCGGEGDGTNLSWTLDNEGTLTISGKGAMKRCSYFNMDMPWKNNRSSIKTVVIEDEVTSIGDYVFYGCENLTEVTIPGNVTQIQYMAFSNCNGLTSVTIEDGVRSIGPSAFINCTRLTNVTIPDSVTTIREYAFSGCSSLSNLTIPDGVTTISSDMFSGCSSLSNLTIPDSVTTIGEYAFSGCSSLSDLIIPGSVTTIGNNAFRGCGLISVTIPNSVTAIGSAAFSNCSSLHEIVVDEDNRYYSDLNGVLFNYEKTELAVFPEGKSEIAYTIPGGVTSVGDYAFLGCTDLTSVTIPDSVNSIGSRAFSDCTGLTSVSIPGSVSSIGGWAFYGCTGLTSMTIPTGVASIGSSAFSDCTGLTSVTIPDSVTSIGSSAFSDCTGLTSMDIPDSVTTIGDYVFYGCTGLTTVTIPDNTTTIGDRSFYNCTGLTTVTIPDGVTSIGDYAFSGCTGLTSVDIPHSVTSIEKWAFYNCTGLVGVYITDLAAWCEIAFNGSYANPLRYAKNLYLNKDLVTEMTIPDGVTSIGSFAFSWCYNLTDVSIPNSVTSIGDEAFSSCRNLTSVVIPDSVTTLGEYAFNGCGLTSVTLSNNLTVIEEDAFSGCHYLASVTIPDSVTTIGHEAFSNCRSMISVTIGESVTTIGEEAFEYCYDLIDVVIPASITAIGNEAFYNCSLKSIYFEGNAPTVGTNAFMADTTTIYYVSGMTGWTDSGAYDAQTGTWNGYSLDTWIGHPSYTVIFDSDGGTAVAQQTVKRGKTATEPVSPVKAGYIFDGWYNGDMAYDFSAAVDSHVILTAKWTKDESIIASGKCGGESVWELDSSGTLRISGTGVMYNQQYGWSTGSYGSSDTPWKSYNKQIVKVEIGDGITTIGDGVFCGLINLSVFPEIPDSVTEIGYGAFAGCENMSGELKLSSKLTRIGAWAFKKCTNITGSLVLPAGVSVIEEEAFAYCTGLDGSLEMHSNVTEIETLAFGGCTSLSGTLEIPGSVKKIGAYAFSTCRSFTSLVIHEGVGSIDDGAFMYCDIMTGSLSIPGTCTVIGSHAFSNCGFNGTLTIMHGVEHIGSLAFGNRTTPESTDMIYNPIRFTGSLTIPGSVKTIGEYAFNGCPFDGKLTLEEGIVSIGKYAFARCNFKDTLTIPGSIESLGEGVFFKCDDLTSLTISDGVSAIGKLAFAHCFGLSGSLFVPGSVKTIGDFAFTHTSFNGTLTLGSGITSIGESAFGEADSSEIWGAAAEFTGSLIIPNTVEHIGPNAFRKCNFNGTLVLSNSLTTIEDRTFWGNSFSGSLVIPDGVTTIGSVAFSSNNFDGTLDLPSALTEIGSSAFSYNNFSGTLEIPSGVKKIGSDAFYSCDFERITIPAETCFSKSTFSSCGSLGNVYFEDGITDISEEMFAYCRDLHDITIPGSVATIGSKAFYGSGLENVYFLGNAPSIDSAAFDNTSDNLTIHYMFGTIGWTDSDSYNAENGTWNGYKLVCSDSMIDNGADNYQYFGHLDAYDHTGSITIDGTKYTMTEEFKNSSENMTVMKSGTYLDNCVYVAYNLNESDQITAAKVMYGTFCTLEGWDPTNRVIDTDLSFFSEWANYKVSDAVAETFPVDKMAGYVGKRVRVYTAGGEVFKIIPVETIYGCLDSVDNTNRTVAVDGKNYNLADNDYLISLLKENEYREVIVTVFDDTVVYACLPDEAMDLQIAIGYGVNRGVVYNGSYQRKSKSDKTNKFTIKITNAIVPNYYGDSVALEEIPELAVKLDEIILRSNGPSFIQQLNQTFEISEHEATLIPDDYYYASCAFQFDQSHVPYNGERAHVTASVMHSLNGKQNKTSESQYLLIVECVNTPSSGTTEDTTVTETIKDLMGDLKLKETLLWDAGINDFLTKTQRDVLGYAIVSTIMLSQAPEETFEDYVSDKVLSSLFGNYKVPVGSYEVTVPITIRVDTKEYGQLIIEFTYEGPAYTVGNSGAFGHLGTISYKIIGGTGKKNVQNEDISGLAGMIAIANANNFAKGIWSVAKAELKSAFNLAYGDDLNEVCSVLFGDTIVDTIIEVFGYDDYSDAAWDILTYPSKEYTIGCPVNVYIYDAAGTLCGSSINDVATSSQNVFVEVIGGEKHVRVFGFDEYRIEIEAVASGYMNISTAEYAGYGHLLRETVYDEIPLERGVLHTGSIENGYFPVQPLALLDQGGTKIDPIDEAEYITNLTKTIDVIVSETIGGSITGEGSYAEGEDVTIIAVPKQGYSFSCWMENGEVVSTDASYTFKATSNRTLEAHYNRLSGFNLTLDSEGDDYINVVLLNGDWKEASLQLILATYDVHGRMIKCISRNEIIGESEDWEETITWEANSGVAEIRGFVLDSATKMPISPMWTYDIPR